MRSEAPAACRALMVAIGAGPAPIMRDPVHSTIPFRSIAMNSPAHPCAKADSSRHSGDGSALFIMNKWMLKQFHA